MSFDPETVRAFEHAGWQKAAAEYNATFLHASGRFVEALLDAAGVGAGTHVLDLCCGTGAASGAAAARGALTTGVDFSAAMLAEARRAHPNVSFDRGDAEQLPYADNSFDAVVANFGIHHVPLPERALGEAFRVLRPGGHLAFTVWAAPSDNIAWKLLFDAVAAHGDPRAAKTPPSGGNLDNPDRVIELMQQAGFAEIETELVRREWRMAEPVELIDALARGTARTAAVIAAQPAAAQPAIAAAVTRAATPYRRADGYAVPIVAILGRGRKP